MPDQRISASPVAHRSRFARLLGRGSRHETFARLLGAFYAAAGATHLSGVGPDRALFDHWHLPTWVRLFTGAFELAAGLLTLYRPTRSAGAVGVAMAMAGATTLHVALGEPYAAPITAVLAALALPIAYWYRSEDPLEQIRATLLRFRHA